MKIHRRNQLDAVAGKDPGRYGINQIEFTDTKDGKTVLVATDGHCLVALEVIPNEDESNEDERPLSLPVGVMKDVRVTTSRGDPLADVAVSDSSVTTSGVNEPTCTRQLVNGDFPDWEDVLPKSKDTHTFEVGINVQLLQKMAKAMGSRKGDLVLSFNPSSVLAPILVRPTHSIHSEHDGHKTHVAILMPMRVDD